MRRKHFLILIILCVMLVAIFLVAVTSQDNNSNAYGDPVTTVLGSNSNGTVYKTICGNQSSNDTVILILGVHALENGTHKATNQTVIELSKDHNLTKKYVVYYIKINWDAKGLNTSQYEVNRHMGELLAYNYIVNDVKQYNPFVVVDVHEMEDYWTPDRYIEVMSENKSTAYTYAQQLEKDTGIPEYVFTEGTSPQWVTIPISNQGFNTILFEYGQGESYNNKLAITHKLIKSLDSLNPKLN